MCPSDGHVNELALVLLSLVCLWLVPSPPLENLRRHKELPTRPIVSLGGC